MVGRDGGHQRRVTDLQCADAVADGDRPHTVQSAAISAATSARVCCAFGCAGVLEPRHRLPAVVIAHHTGEADDGPCGLMRDESLVLGEFDGLLGELGAQHDGGHWVWSLPAS